MSRYQIFTLIVHCLEVVVEDPMAKLAWWHWVLASSITGHNDNRLNTFSIQFNGLQQLGLCQSRAWHD